MKKSTLESMGIVLAMCLSVSGCAGGAETVSNVPVTGKRFVLELSPGEFYRTTTSWFIFQIPIYPQVAAWVETPEGEYRGTIYVTEKGERKTWIGASSEGRPEALPVWNHLKRGEVDAVTAATSPGDTVRGSDLAAALAPGIYVVKLETNRSYDYNDTYTRANAGVCGQPSLVYKAEIEVGFGPSSSAFEPVGTGSLDGSDGTIHEGLEGIGTALKLFSRLSVSYRE